MLVEKLPATLTKAREDTAPTFQSGVAWQIIIRPDPDQAIGHDWFGYGDGSELRLPFDIPTRLHIPLNWRVLFRTDRIARSVAAEHRPISGAHDDWRQDQRQCGCSEAHFEAAPSCDCYPGSGANGAGAEQDERDQMLIRTHNSFGG